MGSEPTKITELIRLLQQINPDKVLFKGRKGDKDPFLFMDSIGLTNYEDGKMIIKNLTKYECIREYAPDDNPKNPYHVWIFIHNYYLHPCDPPIPIYIKLQPIESTIIVAISFHEDK